MKPALPKPERLARRVVYENKWVNLYVDQVRFPNGRVIEQHHLIDFERPSVGVVIENRAGEILFVRVCRYTTGLTEWELPAGGAEDGEDLLEAARREVLEETGYECRDYQRVYSYYPQNGISNKLHCVVRCQAVAKVREFEPDEVSETRWFTREEIRALIKDQEITDGLTLLALLLCLQPLSAG